MSMWPRTACELQRAIADGELTATEVCEAALARLERVDPVLHAFVTATGEHARARARAIDQGGRHDECPLLGVPIAVKDNICTRGIRTTACSRMLETFVPPYDATVVARLERAGAVLIGKTNCDEFAMGSSTENSAWGPTRNPWAPDRAPGGSSGGSAAAVASSVVPVALGSDTGGSVRQPAAFCGVLGLKPTYGRVSRYGLIAFASSLDQVGPLARSARDAAVLLQVMAGWDGQDSTAADRTVPDYTAALTGDLRHLTIGVDRRFSDEGVDGDVCRRTQEALDVLHARGATLIEVELPHAAHWIATYYLVATAEASSNLARYDGVRYGLRVSSDRHEGNSGEADLPELQAMYSRTRSAGFGPEVKRRIMLGTYVLSAGYYDAYYVKAQQVRTLIRRDFARAFEQADVIALPTTPTPAFRLGERVRDPLQMYLADVFTVGASLAGLPAISVPCGFSSDGLPVGLQLIGRMFEEATLLAAADAYERDTTWWQAEPPSLAG